jgi:hypothetical protein
VVAVAVGLAVEADSVTLFAVAWAADRSVATCSAAASTTSAASSAGSATGGCDRRRIPRMLTNRVVSTIWQLMTSAVADGTTMRSDSRGSSSPKLLTRQCMRDATMPPSPARASSPPITRPRSRLHESMIRCTRRS